MLNTPVLFLIFNRPEITARVFQEIRRAKPARLYIAADGPRLNHPDDQELCNRTRQVCDSIDWDCEVKTLFQDENLGCKAAVSNAIDWLFENEIEGIVLEDDCLPSASFFRYCVELLDRYRDDERIMCISGDNFQQNRLVCDNSYYYSKYSHCWGWATWRRAWSKYDHDMSLWPHFRDSGGLDSLTDGNTAFIQYWTTILNKTAEGGINSWAYRWTFSCWAHSGLTCLPNRNLVKNIGFGDYATHTRGSSDWRNQLEAEELDFPLTHPTYMVRNVSADKFSDKKVFGIVDDEKQKNLQIKIRQFIGLLKKSFHA